LFRKVREGGREGEREKGREERKEVHVDADRILSAGAATDGTWHVPA